MFTEQLAEAPERLLRVQLPPGVKVTVPVGVLLVPTEVSVTVALHVEA